MSNGVDATRIRQATGHLRAEVTLTRTNLRWVLILTVAVHLAGAIGFFIGRASVPSEQCDIAKVLQLEPPGATAPKLEWRQ